MTDSRALALFVTLISAVILGGALASQYLGGLQPCMLCLWQRYPYGVAIALGVLALILGGREGWAEPVILLMGVVLLVGAGIAAFHAGVEYGWWTGLETCGGVRPPSDSVEELRRRLLEAPLVRCDEPAWTLLGISLAGFNFLAAVPLGLFTIAGAVRLWRNAA